MLVAMLVIAATPAPTHAATRPSAAVPAVASTNDGDGSSSAEAQALTKAEDTDQQVPVPADNTETETVYANPNGSLTAEISQAPVRVPDDSGKLVPVDTSLNADSGRLTPAAVAEPVSFSSTGDGTLAQMDPAGPTSFGLDFGAALGAPTVHGDSASFPVTGSDPATVSVAATTLGFSAHVVLPSAPAQAPTYTFPLELHGLHAALQNDQLMLTDDNGKLVASSAPLQMWDARRDAGGDPANVVPVDASLVSTPDGGQALQLKPSIDYLTAADTQYPVTIDPDVTAPRAGDTYLTSQYPDGTRSDYYAVRVGSADGTNKWRTIESFYIDRYLGKTVQSATLNMYQYYAATCSNETTNVYAVQAAGDSLPHTWNNQPTIKNDARYNSTYTGNAGASGCAAGQQSIDVTKQVSAYVSGDLANDFADNDPGTHIAMFELRAADELATSQEKRFCSMNTGADGAVPACATAGTNEPVLAITYAPDLGTLGSYSLTSHKLNDRSTLKVNNDNGNALVQAKDVHVNGVGQDLSLTRWYNSLATGTTTSLGTAGWSLSGGPDVYLEKISAYSYNYHAPDGHIYGPYIRSSTDPGETSFDAPTNGGANADLKDNNPATGPDTFTLTFHSSQTKYTFTALGSSGNLYLSETNDRSGNNPIKYAYGSGTQLSSITDTAGRVFDVSYNPAGYISQITDNNVTPARTWQYSYDNNGNLHTYTDPTGAITTYDYTSGSPYYLTKITDPAQLTGSHAGEHPTTVLGYTSGQLTQVQYQNGTSGGSPTYDTSTWAYHSDLSGDTLGGSSCDSDADRYTRVTDSNNHDTLYCFKERTYQDDKTNDVIDALGHHRKNSYNTAEQPSSVTSPEDAGLTDNSTVADYGIGDGGDQDQLDKVTEPTDNSAGAASTIRHHADSSIPGYKYLPTSQVSGNGRCTAYTYYTSGGGQGLVKDAYIGLDPSGLALDCSGNTGADAWHNVYNSHGSILASWDSNGADVTPNHDGPDETVYSYDSVGQLLSVRKPDGSCNSGRQLCTSYTYDGDGRIATKTDGRGNKTTYSYDGDDRTTQLLLDGATTCVLTSGDCIQYTYDGEGNLATRTDQHGTTTLTYDLLNQQRSQETPDITTITTVYDGEANLTSYEQSVQNGSTTDDDTVNYTYNAADQVTKVADSTGDITISPNKDGKPDVIHFPTTSHALSVNYDYFNSGKTKSINVTDAGNNKLPSYSYSYTTTIGGVSVNTDELQKTTVSTASGNSSLDGTITYDYGNAERLTSVTDTANSGQDYSYDYDPAGQLRSMTAGSTTTYFGYNEAGILCWSGATDGTKVAQSCPSAPSGDTVITHNATGDNTGSTGSTNSYDPDERATSLHGVAQSYFDHGNDLRSSSGIGSTMVSYASGPLGVTARTTSAGTTFYTRDPNGNLLDEHGAAGTSYYLTNYQHSVMALVSASGDTFNGAYFYGAYGETNAEARGGGATADNNPWRYVGGYQDTLEGDNYYHFGARYYSPNQGRWTQADPKPGSINDPASLLSYGYADDDPVNQTDISGQLSTAGTLILAGGIAFAAGLAIISGAGAIAGLISLATAGSTEIFGTVSVAGLTIGGADAAGLGVAASGLVTSLVGTVDSFFE
jgi:RHS repeat-associated protein